VVVVDDLEVMELTETSPLSALGARPVVSVPATATLAEAVAAMEAADVSSLLAVEDGDAAWPATMSTPGILTERDVVRALGRGSTVDDPVGPLATRHPVLVAEEVSVLTACAVMLTEDVRHLVVVGADGVSVVSLRDVAAVLLDHADPHLWLASLRLAVGDPSELWIG
jgi:CBS domain-containing protein